MNKIRFLLIPLSLAAFLSCAAPASEAQAGKPRNIQLKELEKTLADPAGKALVIDVRTPAEYESGHIPGAILFPYDEMEARAAELATLSGSKDRPLILYCRSGNRSGIAARTLVKLGYTDIADFGGIGNWPGALE